MTPGQPHERIKEVTPLLLNPVWVLAFPLGLVMVSGTKIGVATPFSNSNPIVPPREVGDSLLKLLHLDWDPLA